MVGMTSRSACDNPVYSDFVEDRHISVCSCDLHVSGQPLYIMMYPCRDLAVSLNVVSYLSNFPVKSAST